MDKVTAADSIQARLASQGISIQANFTGNAVLRKNSKSVRCNSGKLFALMRREGLPGRSVLRI